MNGQQIEKALKICSEGAQSYSKCSQCAYARSGCLAALLSDSLRYIKQLKIPKNSEAKDPITRTKTSRNPAKQGKPVSQWLQERREERARTGAKDCGDIPW